MTALPSRQRVNVADIGGSHITAAVVELVGGPDAAGSASLTARVLSSVGADTDPHGSADEILGAWTQACLGAVAEADRAAAGAAEAGGETSEAASTLSPGWAFAMPDPFDFERGIGTFENVAKFENLSGLDLRAALAERLDAPPPAVRFLHDAAAYGIGEWMFGAAAGHDRAVVITLGTGVGSTFLDHGIAVAHRADVPTNGTVHLLQIDGAPLEDTASTRAILAAYERAALPSDPGTGAAPVTVKQIAERARAGEAAAAQVLDHALFELGAALAPWLAAFEATVLVVGGSMSRSWDLLEPPFRAGIEGARPELAASLTLAASPLLDDAPLLGAAAWAARRP